MNDADIAMAQLTKAAYMSASGICPACESWLNPLDSRWDDDSELRAFLVRNNMTREELAGQDGPVNSDGTYHQNCLDAMEDERYNGGQVFAR